MFIVYIIDYVIYDDAMAYAASIRRIIVHEASLSRTFTIVSRYPVHLSQGSR